MSSVWSIARASARGDVCVEVVVVVGTVEVIEGGDVGGEETGEAKVVRAEVVEAIMDVHSAFV